MCRYGSSNATAAFTLWTADNKTAQEATSIVDRASYKELVQTLETKPGDQGV